MRRLRRIGIVGLVALHYLAREGPMHGYALRRRIEEESGVEIGESTLYDALRRLEKQGLAKAAWTVSGGRLRRLYEPTEKGRRALQEALEEARALLSGIVCGGD